MDRRTETFSCLTIFCLIFLFQGTTGQFPTICMPNATLVEGTCCPIPEGFTEPCGGSVRGYCNFAAQNQEDMNANSSKVSALPEQIRKDDRLGWPARFFSYACQCMGNYWGPACDRCKPGFSGPRCRTKVPRIRRNVLKLTLEEQHLVRDVFNASKYTPSGWSVLNVANSETSDPTTTENLSYYNVSVYDYLVYIHFYASRSTMVNEDMLTCDPEIHILDFAHKAPGFLSWHRYHLLLAEDEFARIASEQFNVSDFSLPYWDWTGKNSCEICTGDLFGEILSEEDAENSLDPDCVFAKWRPICPRRPRSSDCHTCDLKSREFDDYEGYWEPENLWRGYSIYPSFQRLPSQEEVDLTMLAPELDSEPFDANAPNTSFRNSLEGFVQLTDERGPFMHNLVHSFLNGTWFDPATSPNDPVFFLHHAFVDKLYELWLRSKTKQEREFPFFGTRYGHLPYEIMVPFFPPVRNQDYQQKLSTEMGYDYDDNLAGTSEILATDSKSFSSAKQGVNMSTGFGPIVAIVLSVQFCLVLLVVVGIIVRWRMRRRPYQYREVTATKVNRRYDGGGGSEDNERPQNEKTPLLTKSY